jgi:hypothetical protein
MGALELVAMELKGAGAFVSRALSWTVSREPLPPSPQGQVEEYGLGRGALNPTRG